MSKIILIRGPICAGKSTTVACLHDAIKNSSLIDQDYLKRAIDNNKPSSWRDKIAFDTTLYLANFLMKKKRIIIADIHSSISRQYLGYKKLAKKNNYQLFSFLLYPPLKICLDRNKKRIIPDIKYKITDIDIKNYWRNPYRVKEEIIFDTSKISTEEIIEKILATIL